MTLPVPFFLATQNADKAREIVEVFVAVIDAPLVAYSVDGIAYLVDTPEGISSSVRGIRHLAERPDVDETGSTLEANARIKASALADAFGLLALADDTGLEVEALNGAPGVYSARYAGPRAAYADNVAKLLRELEGVPADGRGARFATVAIARWPDAQEVVARGEVEGRIGTGPRGEGGFGYDPVFVPVEGDGRSFAEMSPDEKHAVSHRGRAFRALAAALLERGS